MNMCSQDYLVIWNKDKRKCKGVVALETWIKITTKIVEEVEAHNAQN